MVGSFRARLPGLGLRGVNGIRREARVMSFGREGQSIRNRKDSRGELYLIVWLAGNEVVWRWTASQPPWQIDVQYSDFDFIQHRSVLISYTYIGAELSSS